MFSVKKKIKKGAKKIEEDHDLDSNSSSDEEDDVIVGQIQPTLVPKHIKKRSLKNKALTVSFDDKDLKNYVGGFHKRKKKRRKEAKKQIEQKDRLKRIALRKKRKAEKMEALFGSAAEQQSEQPEKEANENGSEEGDDELETPAPVSETKMYETGDTKITVITSELKREDEDTMWPIVPFCKQSDVSGKNGSFTVKKKLMKGVKSYKKTKGKRNGRR